MGAVIALAGNPNSGKTTIFNSLTGSAQHVGNWPGVTVEKKEGRLKGYKNVTIMDLPGIYSLSPYTLEEIVARRYLIDEKPDVIINIVDASNIERNLYLTTQLLELDIPVIVALNMIDIAERNNDKINIKKLSLKLGCPVIPTSGVQNQKHEDKSENSHKHYFHGHKLHNSLISKMRGLDVLSSAAVDLAESNDYMNNHQKFTHDIEKAIKEIEEIIKDEYFIKKSSLRWMAVKLFEGEKITLESIDVSERIMNDIKAIREELEKVHDDDAEGIITGTRYDGITDLLNGVYKKGSIGKLSVSERIDKVVTNKWLALPIFFGVMWFVYWISISTLGSFFIGWFEMFFGWLGSTIDVLLSNAGTLPWLRSLVVDGIIGGVGGVMVFIPQLMILFFFLSLLEDCGYMARVAFIMDRMFRRFGLSGKSFIPMLMGTGCSIPGVMASRTIENEKDRRMTIMLTPFIPCSAKLPVFAMFISMLFAKQPWVGPSMYLLGMGMVIVSGLILKRTKLFKGDTATFVMELPEYKMPRGKGLAIHVWEKGKSFVMKAGTIILMASIGIWFMQSFSPSLVYLSSEEIEFSILARAGNVLRYVFIPLGFGDNWAAGVASLTGMIAKEVVVSSFAIISNSTDVMFSQVSAYSFMVYTLYAAPCVAAIGAMKREFGNWKWTLIAVSYQTGVAYIAAMIINLGGKLIFRNTAAITPVVLNTGNTAAAANVAAIDGSIVIIIFGAILAAALIIGGIIVIKNMRLKTQKEST